MYFGRYDFAATLPCSIKSQYEALCMCPIGEANGIKRLSAALSKSSCGT